MSPVVCAQTFCFFTSQAAVDVLRAVSHLATLISVSAFALQQAVTAVIPFALQHHLRRCIVVVDQPDSTARRELLCDSLSVQRLLILQRHPMKSHGEYQALFCASMFI